MWRVILDRPLRKLPQSTSGWRCPWLWVIVALSCLAIAFGLIAGSVLGFVGMAIATAVLGFSIGVRVIAPKDSCRI